MLKESVVNLYFQFDESCFIEAKLDLEHARTVSRVRNRILTKKRNYSALFCQRNHFSQKGLIFIG